MTIARRQARICLLLVLAPLVYQTARAGLGPPRDVRSGLLAATLVAVVKPQGPDSFKVEQTLLGKAPSGGEVRLSGFRLFTFQDSGVDLVEPVTPSTRILMFLKRDEKNPAGWEITGAGYCFFWVRDPARIGDLQKIAADALRLRKEWESARDKRKAEEKVKALWPYLWSEDRYFFKETMSELEKLKPVSGDYAADQFDGLTTIQKKMLFGELGALGGEKLHQLVVSQIKSNGRAVAASDPLGAAPAPKASGGLGPRVPVGRQANMARDPGFEADMNTSDGVEALIGFKDPADLPFIREVGLSAARRQYAQTCYSVLTAFQQIPDKANLPVIDSIRRAVNREAPLVVPVAVVKALAAHKYPEAIPILAPYLDEKSVAAEAQRRLTEIVGKDLGPSKQAWLDWFNTHRS